MSLASRSPLFRQIASRRVLSAVRHSSTNITSADIANKASKGLAKAGSTLVQVGSAAGDALGKVGGRTGQVVALVQSIIPRAVYYSRVGLELGKLVAHSRQMSPPSASTFQSYFQQVFAGLRDPSSPISPVSLLARARNVNKQQLAAAGVVAAEVLGFFTVGEIVGRMKLVGYRSSEHGVHH